MSHHTDAAMLALSAQTKASTAYVKFAIDNHIPIATAAMLRAWRYQIRGTSANAAEMKERIGISEYITTIKQGTKGVSTLGGSSPRTGGSCLNLPVWCRNTQVAPQH